jgi:hypothetical protein
MINLNNKQQVIDYLRQLESQLEKEGLIPTLELAIDELITKLGEEQDKLEKEEMESFEGGSTEPTTVAEEMDDIN